MASVPEFCRQFPEEDFYVSEDAATEAVRRQSQFNIIQPRTGLKVDVIVPPLSAFNRARFARARRVRAGDGWNASFSSPEDAIVKKMDFFRAGGFGRPLSTECATNSKAAPLPSRRHHGPSALPGNHALQRISITGLLEDVAPEYVLACGLAHEIGHLLLPPNAHRPDSVMRDSWHPALFPPRAAGNGIFVTFVSFVFFVVAFDHETT